MSRATFPDGEPVGPIDDEGGAAGVGLLLLVCAALFALGALLS